MRCLEAGYDCPDIVIFKCKIQGSGLIFHFVKGVDLIEFEINKLCLLLSSEPESHCLDWAMWRYLLCTTGRVTRCQHEQQDSDHRQICFIPAWQTALVPILSFAQPLKVEERERDTHTHCPSFTSAQPNLVLPALLSVWADCCDLDYAAQWRKLCGGSCSGVGWAWLSSGPYNDVQTNLQKREGGVTFLEMSYIPLSSTSP